MMNQILTFLLLLVSDAFSQLLSEKKDIEVLIGREAYLEPSDLQFFNIASGETCKVEVVMNEPMSQRVGLLDPQVFDCFFKYGTVKYTHHGSPLLTNDTVKLRTYKFLKKDTISESFDLNIIVRNEPYNVIHLLKNLEVKFLFGLTDNVIDESVINFNYSRSEGSICKARMSRYVSNRPAFGKIVVGSDEKPVDVIKRRCDDFLNLGLRYEHERPPAPNIDYVVLIIEVSDPMLNNGDLVSEWLHIPIEILPAYPNSPPKASFSNMYMDVDPFTVTTLLPSVLSSTDRETPSEMLVFNISHPLKTHQGMIIHISDPMRPITSFRQGDLKNFNIAYKPPSKPYKEKQTFNVTFTVFDGDFTAGKPFTLHLVLRPGVLNGPQISMHSGMVMLEGQSRPIRPKNLDIVASDSTSNVQIFVTGGLHHGKLEVGRRPAVSFTRQDIEAGRVIYHHDDSDTTKDSIHLRVYDGTQSTHTKIPITIIPKDDNPPSLIINTGLKVNEGGSGLISAEILRAVDHDTSDEHITYIIKKPATTGTLKKKFALENDGNIVQNFTQRDLNKGLLYYLHNGNEVYVDSFDIVIQDVNNPPNSSPLYKVRIHVTPMGDEPPKRDLASSFSLELLEVDVGVLNSKHIHYFDADSSDKEIIFIVSHQPKYIGSFSISDPGKIVYIAEDSFPVKNVHTPSITNFTQDDINNNRIAYMPPMDDIGPNALHLQCTFAISDKHGNMITGQVFNITLLPVNNQIPQLHTGFLLVEEGSSTLLSINELSVYDPDTLRTDLQMSLFTIPLHGSLRRSGQPLRVGDLLSLDDILTLRLEYTHDGSESFKDSFKVGVNDGLHFVAGEVQIDVEPVDDETPEWLPGLQNHIFVNESGIFTFTSKVLAATDVDTDDELLFFILTQFPHFGDIVMDNRKVTRFTQKDILDSSVKYLHNAQEIGLSSKEDGLTVVVTDQAFPRLTSHVSHKIKITILPKDNQPPSLSFKKTILVSEGKKIAVTEDNLSASDLDTSPSDIVLVISEQPQYGYLENMRPMPGQGYNGKGMKIDSFTMEDIKKGFILYVQSLHRGMEPESDSFKVYATDGVQNSSEILALVSIILQNDEEPEFQLSNITVEEGGSFSLDSNSISAADRDFPTDIMVLRVKSNPRHGTLSHMVQVIDNGPVLEIPFKETAMENFDNIVYRHDGTENFNDSFTLVLSDGVHKVSKVCHVVITSVNDEPPVVWRNIVSKQHESTLEIGNDLLQAKDPDSTNEELIYKVLSSVKCGILQRKENGTYSEEEWHILDPVEFSQTDINLKLIRYKFTSSLSFCHEDGFTFLVSDGLHETSPAVFMIELIQAKPKRTEILNNVYVERGKDVALNASSFQQSEDNYLDDSTVFHIVKFPSYGNIVVISNASMPNESFSTHDLANHLVLYSQTVSTNSTSDTVEFAAENRVTQRNETLVLSIVIKEFPSELLNLEVLNPLAVEEGDFNSSLITTKQLRATDSANADSEIFFSVIAPPQFGNLVSSNGEIVMTFSQEDINNNLISYKSNQSSSTIDSDQFLFVVRSETNSDYLIYGQSAISPTVFHISIKSWTRDPAVTVLSPTRIETVWNGHLGYELSSDLLKAFYPGVTTTDIRFYVVKYLQNAYIFHASDEKIVRMFTQEEVDRHNIVVILKQGSETEDFFTFHVAVGHVTYKKENRMEFHWSAISFPNTQYTVCENSGSVNITIERTGNLDVLSHISISTVGLTAKEGLDFIPETRRKVHFDPGMSEATWQMKIVHDDIVESQVEQVQVVLFRPENAVIGLNNQTLVSIFDFNKGSCADSQLLMENKDEEIDIDDDIEGDDETSSPVSNMVCDQHINGLLQFNHTIGVLFSCNGHEWVPWNPTSTKTQPDVKEFDGFSVAPSSKPLEILDDLEDFNLKITNKVPRLNKQRSSPCPKAWQPFGRECFRFYRQQSTWSSAQKLCKSDNNSYLATVKSSDHNDWLIQLARNKPFWIGLHALPHTNAWNYNSMRGVPYTNWKKGFPRLSSNGELIKHKCVLVRGSGYWINRHCEYHEHSFICALPLGRKT